MSPPGGGTIGGVAGNAGSTGIGSTAPDIAPRQIICLYLMKPIGPGYTPLESGCTAIILYGICGHTICNTGTRKESTCDGGGTGGGGSGGNAGGVTTDGYNHAIRDSRGSGKSSDTTSAVPARLR